MPYNATRRRKPALTGHQKNIRFLTRLSVVICSLVSLAFFWFMNRPGSLPH